MGADLSRAAWGHDFRYLRRSRACLPEPHAVDLFLGCLNDGGSAATLQHGLDEFLNAERFVEGGETVGLAVEAQE